MGLQARGDHHGGEQRAAHGRARTRAQGAANASACEPQGQRDAGDVRVAIRDEEGNHVTAERTNKKGEDVTEKQYRPMDDQELYDYLGVKSTKDIEDFAKEFLGVPAKKEEEAQEPEDNVVVIGA